MKKILSVLVLSAFLFACNNEKKEEKKTEETNSTTPAKTDPAAVDNNTNADISGVPNFSDPEVQKFANDYAVFIKEYRAGMKDPARLEALSKSMQDWSGRGKVLASKLASNPVEAQKWAQWWIGVSRDLYPSTAK